MGAGGEGSRSKDKPREYEKKKKKTFLERDTQGSASEEMSHDLTQQGWWSTVRPVTGSNTSRLIPTRASAAPKATGAVAAAIRWPRRRSFLV